MQPASRRTPGSQGSPSTRRLGGPAAPASSRRLPAAAAQSGSGRGLQRGAPAPQPNPRGGPPGKKDNTPMIVGGVAAGLLLLVGLGFAMMGGEKPKKKEEPKAAPKVEAPKPPDYDPWKDPNMMGSETDQAKRRKEGNKEQSKTGEVDRPKDGTGGK